MEKAADYFDLPRGMKDAPFMTFALRVRPNAQPMLGAITHVDGTARLQTVAREANPRYWSLLGAFERHAGIPILLNTSFNNNAEPIVDSVDEAISCFLTTGLDLLVVGDFVVRKRDDRSDLAACHGLVPSIALTHKLVAQTRPDGTRTHSIESTANRYFTTKTVPLTHDAYAVLQAADGVCTVDDLLSPRGITSRPDAEGLERTVGSVVAPRACAPSIGTAAVGRVSPASAPIRRATPNDDPLSLGGLVTSLSGEGTFYLFVSIEESRLGSEAFCRRLLEEHGVSTVPGIGYGERLTWPHCRRRHARCTCALERITTAHLRRSDARHTFASHGQCASRAARSGATDSRVRAPRLRSHRRDTRYAQVRTTTVQ